MSARPCRNLILILGDQLDESSAALRDMDPKQDWIWMAEVAHESTKVWSSKPRTTVFLSAMRHFRDRLRQLGWTVLYRELLSEGAMWTGLGNESPTVEERSEETFGGQLAWAIGVLRPRRMVTVEPGEWSVQEEIRLMAERSGIPVEVRPDTHFLCSLEEFRRHAEGRRQLRMEFFYREQRRRLGILMEGNQPAGGAWNFDAENREAFGKEGPVSVPPPRAFPPDAITARVIGMVRQRFAGHPGALDRFDWPVTRPQAVEALQEFIAHRLPQFGRWQDAMWTGEPWLYHSRLSVALNLKLLHPREVVDAVEKAWKAGAVSLASAEGFIRQVIGWREYVRGIYWTSMPGYLDRNALNADQPLPAWFWTGKTGMNCLADTLQQTLDLGYAHHIQRLMVTGLFSLLLGIRPREVHAWYLAVYVDAVEWVELPNTLGMSQYADGGVMASKPYIASGKYIDRMSNYCRGCRYNPAETVGSRACPFTTLYWDFLIRHEALLASNPRMGMQVRNLGRLGPDRRKAIQCQADWFRDSGAVG